MSADDQALRAALAGFGRAMGLPGWGFDAAGRAALRLQSGTTMVVSVVDDGALVQVDCPLAFEPPQLLQRALEAVQLRHGPALQLGLRGSGTQRVLQVAQRVPARELSAEALARAAGMLMDWFEALRRPASAGAWR